MLTTEKLSRSVCLQPLLCIQELPSYNFLFQADLVILLNRQIYSPSQLNLKPSTNVILG